MRQAILAFLIFLSAAALVIGGSGCGGGGGGGGSNGGSGGGFSLFPATVTIGSNGRVYLHAVQNGVPVDVTWSATSGAVIPTSIGSAYWEGSGSGTVTITASNGSNNDTTVITIDATKASIYGRIIDSQGFAGINGAIIDFKQGNTNVASATSIPTGYFMAAVPVTANRFHVRSNSVSSAFYKQYTYNLLRYTMLTSTCSAPLPSVSVGTATGLLTNVVVAVNAGPPPPPPNGCQ